MDWAAAQAVMLFSRSYCTERRRHRYDQGILSSMDEIGKGTERESGRERERERERETERERGRE